MSGWSGNLERFTRCVTGDGVAVEFGVEMTVPCVCIGVGQLRSRTREYVDRAAAGESIGIMRRGRPVARIESSEIGVDTGSRAFPTADRSLVVPACLNDLRTSAGRLLDRVSAGAVVQIVDGGRIIAQITRSGTGSRQSQRERRCNIMNPYGPDTDDAHRSGRRAPRRAVGDGVPEQETVTWPVGRD